MDVRVERVAERQEINVDVLGLRTARRTKVPGNVHVPHLSS